MNFELIGNSRTNLTIFWVGVIFYWILSLIIFQKSEVPADAGDGIFHYQLAHWAWEFPQNLLNHWGKPLFTILSSPFAQFGLIGMMVFNLCLFTLSSWLLYRLANHFRFWLAGLSPFVLMSSMLYFKMVNAGMTEVLMGTLCLLALYLLVKNKTALGAVVISLTIVTRPESVVVIPLYVFLLLIRSEWKKLPLLASGFLLFSLLGWLFFSKDFLWIITDDPYAATSPYGSGDADHFIRNADLIFGPFTLILSGIALVLFLFFQLKNLRSSALSQALFFSLSSVVLVLGLHSYLWGMGLKGSLGLIRVMASVVPMASFAALYGFHSAISWKIPKVIGSILIIALIISCNNAIQKSKLPTRASEHQKLQAKAAEYVSKLKRSGRIAYLDPYFGFKAGLNPEDTSEVILLWEVNSEYPSNSLRQGELVVWDSKFGPGEGGMPESSVTDSPKLTLLKSFKAETPMSNGQPYRIYIAQVENGAK